jgi:hypothetical protein
MDFIGLCAPISFRVADEAVAVVMLQRLWVHGEHDEPAHPPLLCSVCHFDDRLAGAKIILT